MDFEKSRIFILKRILDRADDQALKWLSKHYTKEDIRGLLLTTKDLSAKTANFWATYLNINPKEVPCLQKPHCPRVPIHLTSWYLNRL